MTRPGKKGGKGQTAKRGIMGGGRKFVPSRNRVKKRGWTDRAAAGVNRFDGGGGRSGGGGGVLLGGGGRR